jgi:hypothetical protein
LAKAYWPKLGWIIERVFQAFEIVWLGGRIVSSELGPRNKSAGHETILGFWCRTVETPHGYQPSNERGAKGY